MELVEELMQVCPIRTQWTDIALSGKLLAVKAILDSLKQNTDEKVVIVSSFVQTLNILEQMCLTSRFSACRLDGWACLVSSLRS
jgi:DNA repair and recombination protein RAD54B